MALALSIVAAILFALAYGKTSSARHTERQALLALTPQQDKTKGYTSSASCRACHPSQYDSWHKSFHRTMTQLAGTNWDLYRASAHLFTQQLLSRRNGPVEMRAFIRQLQNFKNSQFAFLKSFQLTGLSTAKKTSLLDVEKWWTVARTQFRSRDRRNNWSTEQSLAHLEEILRMQPDPDQPMRLQQGLAKLDLAKQHKHLADSMFRLRVLAINAPPDLQSLIRDYHNTINDYYRQRRLGPQANSTPAPSDALSQRTIRKLNVLDTIMADLQLQKPADTAFGKTLSPSRP